MCETTHPERSSAGASSSSLLPVTAPWFPVITLNFCLWDQEVAPCTLGTKVILHSIQQALSNCQLNKQIFDTCWCRHTHAHTSTQTSTSACTPLLFCGRYCICKGPVPVQLPTEAAGPANTYTITPPSEKLSSRLPALDQHPASPCTTQRDLAKSIFQGPHPWPNIHQSFPLAI